VKRPEWLSDNLLIICFTAMMIMGVMYAPQPLFNILRDEFGVGRATVGLTVTMVMLPLAIAPLVYGFVLAKMPAKRLLLAGIGLLIVLQLGLCLTRSFGLLLALRLGQGLLVPAVLTSLMTYIGRNTCGKTTQKIMGVYIASTIVGGLLGRLVPGLISTLTNWRMALFAVVLGLCVCFALLLKLRPKPMTGVVQPSLRQLPAVLRQPGFARMYGIIFLVFFVYVSIMNNLPFRLQELTGGISEFGVGAMYTGHLVSLAVAFGSMRLVRILGSEMHAVVAGVITVIIAGLIFLPSGLLTTWGAVFVMCGGMFLIHAVLPGYLNSLSSGDLSLVNGLYLSIYYMGGALGSYFPGFIYRSLGWDPYILCMMALLLAGLLLAVSMFNFKGGR
jgi:YNFM family putative membrane transporter